MEINKLVDLADTLEGMKISEVDSIKSASNTEVKKLSLELNELKTMVQ